MVMVVLCFRLVPAAGQDIHRFSQFFFNPSLLNPSLTGIDGQTSMVLSYRKQWVGINGAPELSSFSVQAPGKHRIAVGLNASSESVGLLKSTGVRISSGYNLPAGDGRYFRFGMSAGVGWNRVDVAGLQFGSPDPDPVTGSLTRSSTGILASAGVSYHSKSFHFGLAAPALFEPDYITGESFVKGQFKPLDQLILHTSFRQYLSGNQNVINYYINYRLNKNSPSQVEVATTLHLAGKGWVGASWKQGPGISGLVGINLSNKFAVGYAYTMKGAEGNVAFPGHEIQLGVLLGQRSKGIPSYSFINSEQETKGNRKPGMVAAANRKPGYVPLQKGAVIAKGPSAKPLPPKPGAASGKPMVATGKPAGQPVAPGKQAPGTKPGIKSPQEKPTTEPSVVVAGSTNKPAGPAPVANPEPSSPPITTNPQINAPVVEPRKVATDQQPAVKPEPVQPSSPNPAVAETKVQPKTEPVNNQQPAVKTELQQVAPAKPVIAEATAKPKNEPGATQPQPIPKSSEPKEQQVPLKQVVTVPSDQQKKAEEPVKPQELPTNTAVPDKSQGRPRLSQQAGAFDDQLPGEPPSKPVNKPAPEEEVGEDVAGLHGTRHVQDSLQEVDEQERLSRLTLHNDDPTAAHSGDAPHAERHEFVRRGGHQSEMSAGDYVIVGVFKTEVNAKRWADGLKGMGFKDIDYGFLTERTVWYVHFAGTDDLTKARTVRDQSRKLKVFRDAWLLTVQE